MKTLTSLLCKNKTFTLESAEVFQYSRTISTQCTEKPLLKIINIYIFLHCRSLGTQMKEHIRNIKLINKLFQLMSGKRTIGQKQNYSNILKIERIDHLERIVYTKVQIDSHEFLYPIGKKFDLQIYKMYHHATLLKTTRGTEKQSRTAVDENAVYNILSINICFCMDGCRYCS